MSIGRLHIITGIYLCSLTIYGYRQACYNETMMEEVRNYRSLPELEGMVMAVSKAQQKAVHKYVKKNYDRLELTMPKGEKAVVKVHADAAGESVNAFILRAVHNAMEPGNASQGAPERSQGPVLLCQVVDMAWAQAHAERMEESVEAFVRRAVENQASRDEMALKLKGLKK